MCPHSVSGGLCPDVMRHRITVGVICASRPEPFQLTCLVKPAQREADMSSERLVLVRGWDIAHHHDIKDLRARERFLRTPKYV
jgi:hypothetical protein